MSKRTPVNQDAPRERGAAEHELPLRVTVVRPPRGVMFCLQAGRDELVGETLSTGEDIHFDLAVRVKDAGAGESPRLLGRFTQGPPGARFLYVCSGTLAGQTDSCWTRRAKLPLTGITWPLVRKALARPTARLEARFNGTAGDGGPSCATVPLLGDGWGLAG